MRSNNREYLPAVDHLRAAAAALVVIFHGTYIIGAFKAPGPGQTFWIYSHNPLVTFVAEGNTGVALFMVLSGFILTTGSLGRDINYRSFMRNRLLRVGPLYLVLLLVSLVVARQSFSLLGAIQTTLGFARFNGGFWAGPFAQVLWTIGVEVQFYLIFPFFLRLLNNRGPKPLVLFATFMIVLRVLAALTAPPGMDYAQLTYYSLVGRIDQFLIGMLAAFAFPHVRRYLGRPWVVGVAMALVVSMLWVFNQVHGNAEPTLLRTVWVDIEALAWAALVLGYVSTARFGRGRLSTALAWTGERSYGMYLLHMPLVHLVVIQGWRLDTPGGPVLDAMLSGLVLVLPGAVLLATLSYSAVEQPFLSLRRRYVSLEAAPAPVDTTMVKAASVEPATERLRLPVARVGA